MKMHRRATTVPATAFAIAIGGFHARTDAQTLTILQRPATFAGPYVPGESTYVAAISADGMHVVGTCYQSSLDFGRAVRWTGATGAYLEAPVTGWSQGWGLSPDGSHAVGFQVNFQEVKAFCWTAPGTGTSLWPALFRAAGVDASGTKVIGSYIGTGTHAALWNNGSQVPLSTPFGWYGSVGRGISPNGVWMVGEMYPTLGSNGYATIWGAPTAFTILGTLPGGTWSRGTAVSANGQAATGAADTADSSRRAFRWTAQGGIQAVTCSWCGPYEPVQTWGNTISTDGSVVAGGYFWPFVEGAFFSTYNGVRRLDSFAGDLGIDITGWVPTEITGISADGRAICGNGYYQGQVRAWVLRGIPSICSPAITAPWNVTACEGYSASMNVTVFPPHPSTTFTLQWFKKVNKNLIPVTNGPTGGGSTFSGAQTATLHISPCAPDAAGTYVCVATGGCDATTSAGATVTVISEAPMPGPSPLPLSICQSSGGGWTVTGTNPIAGPFTHRWYFESPKGSGQWIPLANGSTGIAFGVGGGTISGATSANLFIQPAAGGTLKIAHSTRYRCRVFNQCTFTDSAPGELNICFGDANCDGFVDDTDFVVFATAYDIFDCADSLMPLNCLADFNGDGVVDDGDFVAFVAAYNNLVCP